MHQLQVLQMLRRQLHFRDKFQPQRMPLFIQLLRGWRRSSGLFMAYGVQTSMNCYTGLFSRADLYVLSVKKNISPEK